MKKNILYLSVTVFLLFLLPISVKASVFTYGINSITVDDEKVAIRGWAYYTLMDYCNSDNRTYNGYKMTDKNGNDVGVAERCAGKGIDSVKYRLYAQPNNNNNGIIYAKNRDGNSSTWANLRVQGTSATCVDYFKPTVNGKAEHCDGFLAPLGEFPNEPVNYSRRNFNVQNNTPQYNEGQYGTYFYDDIGFFGYFDLSSFKDGETYKIYLEVTHSGTGKSDPHLIAAPGLVVTGDGLTVKSDGQKVKVNSNFDQIFINHGLNQGKINQEKTMPYYNDNGKIKQKGPSSGGGYFKSSENYVIKEVLPINRINLAGDTSRLGGFEFYNLGTKKTFNNDKLLLSGNVFDRYYAISPWISYSGLITIKKDAQKCGGTLQGSDERKAYCDISDGKKKPSDYNICCSSLICGGTKPGTAARRNYCRSNPNDTACCFTPGGGNCPIEIDDKFDPIDPEYYTYWNNANTTDTGYRTTTNKGSSTEVKDYPKYCAASDSTYTLFTRDKNGILEKQYNKAFCYQKGSFTTTSPNKADYILTYSGGAYSLNVNYDTELICVSLDQRRVVGVDYYDEDCNYKGHASNDRDIHFADEEFDSDTVSEYLLYNKEGKFSMDIIKDKIKNIPQLYLVDTTTHQTVSVFNVDTTINEPTQIAYSANGSSSMFKHMSEIAAKDSSFSDPLGGFPTSTFVQKLEITKYVDDYNSDSMKSANLNQGCRWEKKRNDDGTYYYEYSKNCNDQVEKFDDKCSDLESKARDRFNNMSDEEKNRYPETVTYNKDHYYGILERQFGRIGGNNYSASDEIPCNPGSNGCVDINMCDRAVDDCKIGCNKNCDRGDKECRAEVQQCRAECANAEEECEPNWVKQQFTITDSCSYGIYYEGEVTKTMYVTIEDTYKEESIKLNANYTLTPDSVPDKIKDRFEELGEKYVSQVNLSDYYQITLGSSDYNSSDGKYFGVAGTWNMDKALCALDVTDHYCNPEESTCACKYDKKGNLEKGVYYSDCLDFRVVSVSSLFPGKGSGFCVNPTSNCRQPGRNWLYVSNDFKRTDNFNYTKDKPMYHVTLTPSTMNKIASDYKEYYTNIDLGSWYNPSKCTYNGNSRCSSDYESSILNSLGSSVFTRNYDIINTRYRTLKNMPGVNVYKTSRSIESGD